MTEPVTTTTTPEAPDGATVFAQAGCGSCHTLAAAGAAGRTSTQLAPTKEAVVTIVTNGRAAMPSFADQLDAEEIEAVAEYVSGSAG